MKIFKKIYYIAILPIYATLFKRIHFFNEAIYKNKRIIIIGPADTSLNYMPGSKINQFDLIVRINKSPQSLIGKEHLLGSRTDVLYHCFDEDPVGGGGKIDFNLLEEQKTNILFILMQLAV